MSLPEKRKLLGDTRNFLLSMANGSYASAVLYCPELNAEDLAAAAPGEATDAREGIGLGGLTFMKLLDRCLADPAQRPDSFAEQFLAPLAKRKLLDIPMDDEKKRKELEQELVAMAAMITTSRRFVLLTFVCKVLSEVLGVPFDELAPATSLLQPLKATESQNVRGMLFKETPDLRFCSNSPCSNQEEKEKAFLVCAPCRKAGLAVPYCSRACQAADWREHKKTCGVAPTKPPAPANTQQERKGQEPEKGKPNKETKDDGSAPKKSSLASID